jgi:O-antigen/teichoic acid export membrane protein
MTPSVQGTRPDAATSDAAARPRAAGLAGRTIRASAWTGVGFGTRQLVRFAANVLLARLLFPEMFGLMALVSTVVQGIEFFSDIGVSGSIVQNRRGDDATFLNTAWTLQVMRGALLWAAVSLAAVPVSQFYEEPALAVLMPIVGIGSLIDGFRSTALATRRRHLRITRVVVQDLVAQVSGVSVMLAWAWTSPTVWALVAGGLVAAFVRMLLSHTLEPGRRNRFHFDRTCARELYRFGRWIFVSTALTYLANQSDRLILGKLVPLATLGVYQIGVNLATLATSSVLQIGSSVVFPAYSRVHQRGDPLAPTFRRVRLLLELGGALVVGAILCLGPALVALLYDARYADAGWIVRYVACGVWFQILSVTIGSGLLALGTPRSVATSNFVKLTGIAAGIPLGFSLAGMPGALLGLVASDVAKYVTMAWLGYRRGLAAFGTDALLTAWLVVTVAAALGVGHAATAQGVGVLPCALAQAAVFALGWLPWLPTALRALRGGLP